MSRFPRQIADSCRQFLALIFSVAVVLSLPACGSNGNTFSGSGNGGTVTGALSVAQSDIASGNYSGAISVLAPYCPNKNCPNSDIANAYANALMAMGNTSSGTVTGATAVTGQSGAGATTTTILNSVLNLIGTGAATPSQVMTALSTAIPCLAANTCNTNYLDNLSTAIEVLSNTACSPPSTVSSNCPDSSTTLIVSAVYLLVAAQYETGITYSGSAWELCTPGGGGIGSCSNSLNTTTITDLLNTDTARLANLCLLLGGNSCSSLGTSTWTFTPVSIPTVVPFFSAGLSSNSQSVVTAVDEFFESIYNCSITPSSSCAGTQSTTATVNAAGLAYYLSQL